MSVYTDSCRWISFTGSRMRESRTSGSERGKPCKGLTYLPNSVFEQQKKNICLINMRLGIGIKRWQDQKI